jgi:chromate transporter
MTDASLTASTRAAATAKHGVSLTGAFRVWLRIAALSFGGPAGQIAVMHRMIGDEKKWVGENRFLHALSYCMLLPGPEAHQLAIYIGWLMHRWPGAIIAGGLFVLPGIVSIMALSMIYAAYGSVPVIAALFLGLKAAVLTIVLHAVQRVGSRALKSRAMLVLAALAFIGIFFFAVPFPVIVIAAGVIGFVGARSGSSAFQVGGDHRGGGKANVDEGLLGAELPEHARPTLNRALRVSALWLALWLAPVLLVGLSSSGANVYTDIGAFFSKMAVVTFGGACAVLAYMAQQAVETYQWLKPGEMLDGLGMAETTPGPLIMVVQFVGFLAAYRAPGTLPPMLAGALGGLLATWCTFVPCFLWIGLGAPFIEKPLSGALAGITAAVVGVILNLAIWFALTPGLMRRSG